MAHLGLHPWKTLERKGKTPFESPEPLEFDAAKSQYAVSTITRTAVVNTHDQLVIKTEKGLPLRTDNATQQKLWVRKDDGSVGWLSVTKLRVGDYLLDALDRSWVRVTGIEYITGSFTMYDIYGTAPYNYIANDYLDPYKEGPSG